MTDSELLKDWYGIDIPDENIEFLDSISDFSWGALLVVVSENGKFYINDDFDNWKPRECSEDEAIAEILDFCE